MHESLHIADLIVKKIKESITAGEQQDLDKWIKADPGNQTVYKSATDPRKQLDRLEIYGLFNKERVWANLEDELFGARTVKFTPARILRYAAAIILPLVIAGGLAYIFLSPPPDVTIAEIDSVVKPGSQKAMLLLSDGSIIELDQETSLVSMEEGDASITNEKMLLSYSSDEQEVRGRKTVYNELRTPRGGGYNLKLADGTGVWLNSGSSLRFPVSFQDSVRQVALDGEAYFEVSHNGKPFVVTTENMNTRVLGTSFNISAYSDDPLFLTTLVEGKVSVELIDDQDSPFERTLLAPDEQATYIRSESEISKAEVNASSYISWMNGKMEFHNETLETVMKRMARWYDFEYRFENAEAKEYHFSARLDRDESISVILEMLEMTTNVKFEYKDNTIVVL